MTYKIKVTTHAKNDLRSIYEYIAFYLKSPENAASQLDRIEKNIYSLSEMPDRFRLYEEEPWHSLGLHVMPVDNYLIFYIPDGKDKIVTIISVMYGRRNIAHQLDKYYEETLITPQDN